MLPPINPDYRIATEYGNGDVPRSWFTEMIGEEVLGVGVRIRGMARVIREAS